MTYKRQPEGFKARLAARADKIRRARIARPYSPTLAQQFEYLAEDQELARIRQEQVAMIISPSPKSKVGETLFLIALYIVLAAIAFILFTISLDIGGFLGIIFAVPACMLTAGIFFGGIG